MGDIINFEITIPTDKEGFILLKCPLCGELFKLKLNDFEDDRIFNVYCPSCGLVSENYITEDVLELAQKIIKNYANDIVEKSFKSLEKSSKGIFKFTSNIKRENEQPIMLRVEALEKKFYACCKMEAKIKPILKFSGSYCPYCGVKDYGIE